MKITFTFVERPGLSQVASIEVRSNHPEVKTALQQAQHFVEGITTVPVERISIDLPAPELY